VTTLKVVYVDGNIVASSVVESILGALFAKKLCEFLISLEADDPRSSKMIGCLLKEGNEEQKWDSTFQRRNLLRARSRRVVPQRRHPQLLDLLMRFNSI
jgi:hypothetical protein